MKMLNPNSLSDEVRESILQSQGWEDDKDFEEKLSLLSVDEAFDAYCVWHGLIGYAKQLSDAYKNIKQADVRDKKFLLETEADSGHRWITTADGTWQAAFITELSDERCQEIVDLLNKGAAS